MIQILFTNYLCGGVFWPFCLQVDKKNFKQSMPTFQKFLADKGLKLGLRLDSV